MEAKDDLSVVEASLLLEYLDVRDLGEMIAISSHWRKSASSDVVWRPRVVAHCPILIALAGELPGNMMQIYRLANDISQTDGRISRIPGELRDNLSVVLHAITENPTAINFVEEKLVGEKEIVLAILRQRDLSIFAKENTRFFTPTTICRDREVWEAMAWQDHKMLEYLPAELRDQEFIEILHRRAADGRDYRGE